MASSGSSNPVILWFGSELVGFCKIQVKLNGADLSDKREKQKLRGFSLLRCHHQHVTGVMTNCNRISIATRAYPTGGFGFVMGFLHVCTSRPLIIFFFFDSAEEAQRIG